MFVFQRVGIRRSNARARTVKRADIRFVKRFDRI